MERGKTAAGTLALACIVGCSAGLVLLASARPSVLVPSSATAFPGWLAGPLHPLSRGIALRAGPIRLLLSAALVAMALAYGAAVACGPTLRPQLVVGTIAALHGIWLLSPPMPLTDVFNYLGYARLAALHGLSPYAHGIGAAPHDPVLAWVSWRRLRSPYGPLFTLASEPLGRLPLPFAFWLLKLATVAASLGCVALLRRCARLLGRSPERAALLYAANPLVLVYALGGFHNDVFMLLAVLGGVALLLARREAAAGASLAAAIAIKASAGVLLPFALLGARRRGRLLSGALAATAVVALLSLAAFGVAAPSLGEQGSLLTRFSVPNALGQLLGLGGAPSWLLAAMRAAMGGAIALLALAAWRGRIGWLAAAGWATLALLASLAWLQPWYAAWLLPLAALARSRPLRYGALVLCAYVLLTFLPATGLLLQRIGYAPMASAIGHASIVRMHALMGRPRVPLRESRGHAALRASRRQHGAAQRRRGDPRGDRGADARADGAQRAARRGHGQLHLHAHRGPRRGVPGRRGPPHGAQQGPLDVRP
jgi:alpha-1,6-mannosyltransferase